jgi:hydroxymethylpyrimidine/phosphomethylpyrimidine kinase
MKTALTIAGSDSSGGAGIQADLKTFSVLGVYGMSAITAVTAQNTLGVKEIVEMTPAFIREQIDTSTSDIPADATKTGMLGSPAVIEVVEDCINRNKLQPYVCDPVMVAKSGDPLLKTDAVDAR